MLKHFKTFTKGIMERRNKSTQKNINFRSLTMCKKCYTFYYKNSWHFEGPKELELQDEATVPVSFKFCPACVEEELALYDMELA